MECFDMAMLGSELGLSERLFLTREKGEQAYDLLKEHLQTVTEGQGAVLVFPPSQLIDASFADESIVRLGEELIAGKLGDRCILLKGMTEDSVKNINAVIGFRHLKLAFLVVESGGSWRCIGQLESSLHEALNLVAVHGRLTAPELADHLKLAINTASNRLKRLHDRHLVRREYEISEKGLQYIYYFWQWTEAPIKGQEGG
jgi:DNA-binding transcriptional ArsR family regulator